MPKRRASGGRAAWVCMGKDDDFRTETQHRVMRRRGSTAREEGLWGSDSGTELSGEWGYD